MNVSYYAGYGDFSFRLVAEDDSDTSVIVEVHDKLNYDEFTLVTTNINYTIRAAPSSPNMKMTFIPVHPDDYEMVDGMVYIAFPPLQLTKIIKLPESTSIVAKSLAIPPELIIFTTK